MSTKPRRLPTPETVAKWSRAKLVDEFCEAANQTFLFGEILQDIAEGRPQTAIANTKRIEAEFEKLYLIASELNKRLPARGSGPKSWKNRAFKAATGGIPYTQPRGGTA